MDNNHGFFILEESMNRLREFRVVRQITQFQLRLQTGIHQSKISFIENGLISPREDEKKKLAKALGVRVAEIFPEGSKESDRPARAEVFV
jgi:transcriptional regulator with XRE-family HTH domain